MSAGIKEKMNCVRKQKLCFSVEGPRTIIIYYHFSAMIDFLSKKYILFLLDRIRTLGLFCILRSILVSKTCENRSKIGY